MTRQFCMMISLSLSLYFPFRIPHLLRRPRRPTIGKKFLASPNSYRPINRRAQSWVAENAGHIKLSLRQLLAFFLYFNFFSFFLFWILWRILLFFFFFLLLIKVRQLHLCVITVICTNSVVEVCRFTILPYWSFYWQL